MITFAFIVGYLLGAEATMAATTQSPWWIAATIVTGVLVMSGKPIANLADRWLEHD
jgi:hypothetical protein